MSCNNSTCYLPQPPRAWSRVQNSCSLITGSDNNSLVINPYTGQQVSPVVLAEMIAMINKGNILQYKANSGNLTKAQKYSKIARGQWVNRNVTWATQSTRGYTNPNTSSLKRSGNVVNIAINPLTGDIIGPTLAPPTCPQGITTSEPIVIQDGGSLICSVQENICTGETKSSISQQLCHPTTDSDVPGQIRDLCWNDGTQTWYPRQRYIMTNSANKWPVNATLLGAIQINAPVITSVNVNLNIATITWSLNVSCLSASNFNIYQNDILITVIPGNIFTTDIILENPNVSQYFIEAENVTAKIVSSKTNIVI